MKLILTISTIIIGYTVFSQNNYYFGYNAGFKYGCQCMDLSPKNVALYSGTYDQGYLDGKVDGLIFSNNKNNNSTNKKQKNYNKPNNYNLPVYTPDFDLIERALSLRQSTYNSNKQRVDSYVNSLKETIQLIRDKKGSSAVNKKIAALFLLENAFYKDLNNVYRANLDLSITSNLNYAISTFDKHSVALSNLISEIKSDAELSSFRINQLMNLYNSFENKNVSVKDGWHLVYATNQKDFCEIRRVYVSQNRIQKYIKEGSQFKEWDSFSIELSTEISNCKSTLKLKGIDIFCEIFFINVLSDPTKFADSPSPTGKISFWTNYGKEAIHIYIDNQHVGSINSSFTSATPNCGQTGTVVFINTAGTYNYVAVSDKYRWTGSITISANDCNSQKLIE
jgi:hypothetical protein